MRTDQLIENLGVTPGDVHYIRESLKGIKIHSEEILEVKKSGQFNSQGDIVYKVVLTLDGDMERFVCYI